LPVDVDDDTGFLRAGAGFVSGENSRRRRAYVERFVGFDDTRSSARALDEIERRAASDGPR
jgi:hypothetical protein